MPPLWIYVSCYNKARILKIRQVPLSYTQRLEKRDPDRISLIVVHCTELPDLSMARVFGEKVHHSESQTGNSGHFYIDRDGSIEQWVPLSRVAHHVRGFNPQSIGIELVNSGRYPDWFVSTHQQMAEPYPQAHHLTTQLPGLEDIAGHEDLDTAMLPSEDKPDVMIRRKLDPGPHFPWPEIMNKISLNRLTAQNL